MEMSSTMTHESDLYKELTSLLIQDLNLLVCESFFLYVGQFFHVYSM